MITCSKATTLLVLFLLLAERTLAVTDEEEKLLTDAAVTDDSDDEDDDDDDDDDDNEGTLFTFPFRNSTQSSSAESSEEFVFEHDSFGCNIVSMEYVTGTNAANLAPDSIDIVAALGDGLSTGTQLWDNSELEVRGRVFSTGADSNIAQVTTIANMLILFNSALVGVSHGMGKPNQLPGSQLNVAMVNSSTSDLLPQAELLVKKMNTVAFDYTHRWTLIFATIGSDQMCVNCTAPNEAQINAAIEHFKQNGVHGIVVLIGPIEIEGDPAQTQFRSRCNCSRNLSREQITNLYVQWTQTLNVLQSKHSTDKHFAVLSMPTLPVPVSKVDKLLINNSLLLSAAGHGHAARWLWNRLMTGTRLDHEGLSMLDEDDEFLCPKKTCPYIRTPKNEQHCIVLKWDEVSGAQKKYKPNREVLYIVAFVVVSLALCVVCTVGSVLYQMSKRQTKGRFEIVAPLPEEVDVKSKEDKL